MTLKHFVDEVAEELQNYLGDHYEVQSTTTLKNNSVELSGVRIRQDDDCMLPTIYLNDFYQLYCKNALTLSEIVKKVAKGFEESRESIQQLPIINSTQLEHCKDKIVYRLISKKRNKELLKSIPYIPFMDLAITFQVVISINPPSFHSMKITNELLEKWGISIEKLIQLANVNTPRILPPRIVDMGDMLQELQPDLFLEMDLTNDKKMDMIVITNTLGVNGAAAILYPDLLTSLCNKYKTNFYVIPSSIHEVILVPAENDSMTEELKLLVEDVNRQFVDMEEILSDQVYYFEYTTKKFQ